MTNRIQAVREAMLRLGVPLNGLMGRHDLDSCTALLEDAKKQVGALEAAVFENPATLDLSPLVRRLAGAIEDAAKLCEPSEASTFKSANIAVQAARSEFVNALDRLELDLGAEQAGA